MWKVKRMKAARLIVLVIAIAAGGLAALLAGGFGRNPAPAPVVKKVDTVKVLVASKDLPMGQKVGPADLKWQTWPTEAASPVFIRQQDRPDAVRQFVGAIARTSFAAGWPTPPSSWTPRPT